MKRLLFISVIVAVVAVAAAGCCACRKGRNNKQLIGTQWHLTRIMERDLSIGNDQFVFTFDDAGRFTGVGACNRMMGDYTVTDSGGMSFGNIAATRMACPDMELEAQFNKVLEATTHYEIDGDMLLLLSNGEMQAVLKAVEGDKAQAAE